MGTMSSPIFTGTSQFSSDFQQVITRAVSIASLPITKLNSDVTTFQNQTTALNGIDSNFSSLQTAIQGISDAMGGASFQASVSNPALVSASVSDGALEGNYSIEVQNVGAYATSMTTSSWVNLTNPPNQTHTYQLWIGDKSNPANEIDITPSDNSAGTVAGAINAKAGDKVQATVVNVGSSSTPDYRISLQSTTLGDAPLDLVDGTTSLQTQQTTGALAQYVVNGSGKVVTSSSRSVQITNGLTVNLLSSSVGNPANITVTRSTSALSNALSSFATAYNAVVDSLNAQRGQTTNPDGSTTAGPLAGQSIVYALSSTLSGIATYSAQGSSVSGLADLGLSLGSDGKFTFNSFSLLGADLSNSAGVAAFIGSATGGGFLQSATNALNSVEDPAIGILKTTEASIQTSITNAQSQISDKQTQVDAMQARLTQQMAAADATIATMEQQYSYLSNMFSAMQTAAQQYK